MLLLPVFLKCLACVESLIIVHKFNNICEKKKEKKNDFPMEQRFLLDFIILAYNVNKLQVDSLKNI